MDSSYICYNMVDLSDEIRAPLKHTHRIQYTCADASSNYVVLGASSGSIYLFRRLPRLQFLQLIQNMYGPISHVAVSPQEKFVSFSTVKGTICVYVINLTAAYPQIVTAHYEDTAVTCLHWKRTEEQLYYGDNKGNVFVVNLTSFLGRNLTNISIHPILFLEAPIVQISDFDKLLLVSNYAKCILCNTESEEFKQIGSTPRDGCYGACFLQPTNKTNHIVDAKVYCARPGSRLWEADVEGRVLRTSQYKTTAVNYNLSLIQNMHDKSSPIAGLKQSTQLLRRLQPIFGKFIFSYTKNGFCIVDPSTSNIVLWNDHHRFQDIDNVKIVNGTTLIIFTSKSQLFSLSCRSLEDCFVEQLADHQYEDCVQLLLANRSYFMEMCRTAGFVTHVLRLQNALIVDHQMSDELKHAFGELTVLQEPATDVPLTIRQDNGIVAIDNAFTKNRNTSATPIANAADDNIRTVLMSASRNLFNKLNIFNDTDDQDSCAASGQALDDRRIIIPYPDVGELDHSDEIVSPAFHSARPVRMVVQREVTAASVVHKQLSAEDKMLQNLFMIYKSSRMSNLSLVERYSSVFDQYDCHSIRALLQKLSVIMQQNNVADAVARLHCYEMYFNYLNHDLIWEFDDDARQYIINGFVLVNQSVDTVSAVRCSECRFPLMLRKPTTCRYRDIGATIMKYFWSRNQLQQCFELAIAVPWTVELLCKFWLNNGADSRNDGPKVVRLVFATATEAMWLKAVQCAWFGDETWIECFELMARMHRQRQMICANCDKCSAMGQAGHPIESNEFYSWPCFLDCLVNVVQGRRAIRLVRQFASRIPCDAVPKEFYLKCLLVP